LGALDDVIVADFSRILSGPLATMMLADLGATVVKVEGPAGDDTRTWGPPFIDGHSTYFQSVNRNKHAVVFDLRTDAGRAAAYALACRADILVENFRPGVADRLGIGYERVSTANPGLVYCSITGFGREAGAMLPGYDFIVQAVGGLMSMTGHPAGEPTKVGVALVDVIAGQHAVAGVLAALHARTRTGHGQRVEVNLLSTLLASLVNQASGYLGADVLPQRLGNRHPSIAPYETLHTADTPIAVAVGNDRQFRALCEIVGLSALPDDPRFASNAARVTHRDELVKELEHVLVQRPAAAWLDRLLASGVPAGQINDVAQAVAYAHQLGLEPVVEIPDPDTGRRTREVANPLRLSDSPVAYRFPARPLGADTETVLAWLTSGDGNRLTPRRGPLKARGVGEPTPDEGADLP